MSEPGSSIGHKIGHGLLASSAVIFVGVLMVLALLVTLVCAPPLKLLDGGKNQPP